MSIFLSNSYFYLYELILKISVVWRIWILLLLCNILDIENPTWMYKALSFSASTSHWWKFWIFSLYMVDFQWTLVSMRYVVSTSRFCDDWHNYNNECLYVLKFNLSIFKEYNLIFFHSYIPLGLIYIHHLDYFIFIILFVCVDCFIFFY